LVYVAIIIPLGCYCWKSVSLECNKFKAMKTKKTDGSLSVHGRSDNGSTTVQEPRNECFNGRTKAFCVAFMDMFATATAWTFFCCYQVGDIPFIDEGWIGYCVTPKHLVMSALEYIGENKKIEIKQMLINAALVSALVIYISKPITHALVVIGLITRKGRMILPWLSLKILELLLLFIVFEGFFISIALQLKYATENIQHGPHGEDFTVHIMCLVLLCLSLPFYVVMAISIYCWTMVRSEWKNIRDAGREDTGDMKILLTGEEEEEIWGTNDDEEIGTSQKQFDQLKPKDISPLDNTHYFSP